MPVKTSKDKKGCYARWGSSGKKYYYVCGDKESRNKAKQKAHIQGAVITAKTGKKEAGEKRNSKSSLVKPRIEGNMDKKRFSGHRVLTREVTENIDIFEGIKEDNIDIENKTIKNMCVMGTPHSKNGYTYSERAMKTLSVLTEGAACYANHPSKTEYEDRDGVRNVNHWIGVFYNPRKEGEKVFADLKVRDTQECWDLVYDMAILKPKGFGNSINSRVKVFQDPETGQESIVDIDRLNSVDLVSQAATTDNFFESDTSEKEEDEIKAIYDELDLDEGILSDKMKEREKQRAIDRLQWDANDIVDEILRDKDKTLKVKKDEIGSVLDDLEKEINKILNGKVKKKEDADKTKKEEAKKNDIDKDNKNKDNINKEEQMDFEGLTIDQLKKDRPDIVEKIENAVKDEDRTSKLEAQNKDLDKELADTKEAHEKATTKIVDLEDENKELKKENDEYKTKELKAAKEAFITEKIKDSELPDDAISEYFWTDLMSKDEKGIEAAIKDRKKVWTGKETGEVKNSGDEFKYASDKDKKESKKEEDVLKTFERTFK